MAGWFLEPSEVFEGKDSPYGVNKVSNGFEVKFSGLVNITFQNISGRLLDYYGISTITGTILEDKMSFSKVYKNREQDFIEYEFERQGDIWVGKFKERDLIDKSAKYNGQPAQTQFYDITSPSEQQCSLILSEIATSAASQ